MDIKPVNMEELTEVITATEFHPTQCNLFMYSSSKSNIKLADMRDSALCDRHAKCKCFFYVNDAMLNRLFLGFEEEEDPTARSFFSEIISSISDVKFSHDGRYILSRDYLSLKIWDINMESRPVKTIPIHDHLRGKLCDLYENDCIFDKFECIWGGDDKYVPSVMRLTPWSIAFIDTSITTARLIIADSFLQARVNRIVPQLLPDL